MHSQERVRYVSSRLHYLTFPELWKFKLPTKRGFPSEKHLKTCRLKYALKKSGLNNEVLQLITEIFGESVQSHELRDMHPNTLFEFKNYDYYTTPFCYALEIVDRRENHREVLDMILTDSELDVNLPGYQSTSRKYMYTPLEILLGATSFVMDKCDINRAREYIPKLFKLGVVMSINIKSVCNDTVLSEFISLCTKREPLRLSESKRDKSRRKLMEYLNSIKPEYGDDPYFEDSDVEDSEED